LTNYILSIGDSITLGADGLGGYVNGGYRITLETRLNTIGYAYTSLGTITSNSTGMTHPDHSGYSGYRLDEVSPIVLAMNATPVPTYILLCIGTNDIYQSYDLANLNSRLDTFISNLLAKWSGTTILVATIGPMTGFSTTSYNSHIMGLSSATPVDMASVMNSSLQNDGIHPSAIGYSRMGDAWYTALKAKGIFPVANTKITALSSYAAQLAAGDLLPFVDISDTSQAASGTTKKVAAGYFGLTDGSTTLFTGGGTIALGGFTLTVPATGTAALRGANNTFSGTNTFSGANTFTTTQTIAVVSAASLGLIITPPASATGDAIRVSSADLGSGLSGPFISLGRNSNATGRSGYMRIVGAGGNSNDIWPDNSATPGVLRIGNATGTATDLAGSVVGAQTSSLDQKDVIGEFTDINAALDVILDTPLFEFYYKDERLGKPKFLGIITDYSPIFGADPDEAHPNGRILNEVNAHGYAMAAIKALAARIRALEAKLSGLSLLAAE